jgi:hypothetical protein
MTMFLKTQKIIYILSEFVKLLFPRVADSALAAKLSSLSDTQKQ